jgi:hypothetical protein
MHCRELFDLLTQIVKILLTVKRNQEIIGQSLVMNMDLRIAAYG